MSAANHADGNDLAAGGCVEEVGWRRPKAATGVMSVDCRNGFVHRAFGDRL
jgi:hypothetical protein